jgi:hypothetical protein
MDREVVEAIRPGRLDHETATGGQFRVDPLPSPPRPRPSPAYLQMTADALRVSRIQLPIALREFRALAASAVDAKRRPFVRHAVADFLRYCFNRVQPIDGQTRLRMAAAADWLVKAHDATGREGLSYGYFPTKAASGWRGPYPETSGYTIPSLLAAADVLGNDEYRVRALETAHVISQ